MKGHFDEKRNYFVPEVEELKQESWLSAGVGAVATFLFIGIVFLIAIVI